MDWRVTVPGSVWVPPFGARAVAGSVSKWVANARHMVRRQEGMEGSRAGGTGTGRMQKCTRKMTKQVMEDLFELGLAIGNLLLTRTSVGTLAHEEMVFGLEIEGLLQR